MTVIELPERGALAHGVLSIDPPQPGTPTAAAVPHLDAGETTLRAPARATELAQITQASDSSPRDRCEGSGQRAIEADTVPASSSSTGRCPVCEQRLELGYAGIVPNHSAPSSER